MFSCLHFFLTPSVVSLSFSHTFSCLLFFLTLIQFPRLFSPTSSVFSPFFSHTFSIFSFFFPTSHSHSVLSLISSHISRPLLFYFPHPPSVPSPCSLPLLFLLFFFPLLPFPRLFSHTFSVFSTFFSQHFHLSPFFLTHLQFSVISYFFSHILLPPLFSQTHSVAFSIQKKIKNI